MPERSRSYQWLTVVPVVTQTVIDTPSNAGAFVHTQARIAERYGIDITHEQWESLNAIIAHGDPLDVEQLDEHGSRQTVLARIGNRAVVVVYDTQQLCVVTALPLHGRCYRAAERLLMRAYNAGLVEPERPPEVQQ